MEPIRVVIADDHNLFRVGMRTFLDAFDDIELVGEASTGEETLQIATELQPDVILMDIQMPDINGIDATRKILRMSPHIGVVMLTMFKDDDSLFMAMRAGARGYVLKGADQQVVLRAIRGIANGECLFSPEIATRMMKFFATLQPSVPEEIFPELTAREREVLTQIAQGDNNAEIAHKLNITTKTVRNHVSNVFSKLQVADRTQAAIRAREAGLGKGTRSQNPETKETE